MDGGPIASAAMAPRQIHRHSHSRRFRSKPDYERMKQNMWESREKLEPTREQGGRRSGGSPDSRDRYLGAEGQGEMADRPERVGKVERRRRRREEEFAASRGRRELSTERRRAVTRIYPRTSRRRITPLRFLPASRCSVATSTTDLRLSTPGHVRKMSMM